MKMYITLLTGAVRKSIMKLAATGLGIQGLVGFQNGEIGGRALA